MGTEVVLDRLTDGMGRNLAYIVDSIIKYALKALSQLDIQPVAFFPHLVKLPERKIRMYIWKERLFQAILEEHILLILGDVRTDSVGDRVPEGISRQGSHPSRHPSSPHGSRAPGDRRRT